MRWLVQYFSEFGDYNIRGLSTLHQRFWREILVAQTAVIQLYVTVPQFIGSRPRSYADELLFAYTGWIWAQSSLTPYLHVWDVKPPAIHELSALLSMLSGGNPTIAALLQSLSMIVAMSLTALFIGLIVYEYTSDARASYAGGSFLLVFPVYYRLSALGLRPKHFTAVFGLAAVYYAIQHRWLLAGMLSATAAGFWQLGLIFPLCVFGMAIRESQEEILRTVIGGLGATILILLPVILSGWDVVTAMLIQVFGPPIVVQETFELTERMQQFHEFTGMALPLIILGGAGAVFSCINYASKWLSAVACWFLLQVFVVDLDGYPDLLLLIVIAGVGYGFVLHTLNAQVFGSILVLITAATAFVFHGGLPGYLPSAQSELERGTLEWFYWQSELPPSCHIRGSDMEQRFVSKLHLDPTTRECDTRLSTFKTILSKHLF